MARHSDDLISLVISLKGTLSAIELKEKEHSFLSKRIIAAMERKCQILSELSRITNVQLRERVTTLKASFLSTLNQAIGVEVELRLRQMKEFAIVRGNFDVTEIQNRAGRSVNYQNVGVNLNRMEIELRCGICSELMVSATSLNCMHTFCRYCISQWKNFERIRQIEAGCPVCREPATSEKRNYFADNLIEIMVDCYPEEEKNSRKQLVANHQELSQLTQEVLGMRSETNSFSQAINHTGQLMKEIDMQIQDIFRILAEREFHLDALDPVVTPRLPDVPLPEPNLPAVPLPQPNLPVVPGPQPNLPTRLPSTVVVAVIPVQRTSSSSQTSETDTNPVSLLLPNQQRRENAQRDRQSRPAILGIQGPRAIQRGSRTNQSSAARPASGRKPIGTLLSRPRWRY